MSTTKVSKNISLRGKGVLFPTLQEILKQREALDHQILKLQKNLFKVLEKQALGQKEALISGKKKYVPRMKNTTTLKVAIQKSMIPNRKMVMKDILKVINKDHLYHTHSHLLYTMVNNKLHIMVKSKLQNNI